MTAAMSPMGETRGLEELLGVEVLTVGYPGVPEVLRRVNLSLKRGTRLVLLGANGSGKSTLLRCLSGSLQPTSGTVRTAGRPLKYDRRTLTEHRQHVQLVLQDPDDQLFAADVALDVAFGPTNLGLSPDEVATRVEESLMALDIVDLADRPVHHLSYGQRKRVALAGVLAMRPSVLLLDEPTAGLDSRAVSALMAQLADLERRGVTVVMSTHDVELAWRWADVVGVLVDHELRCGDPGVLLRDRDLMSGAGLAAPWQVRLLEEAGIHLDPEEPRPREPREVLAVLRPRSRARVPDREGEQ